ncbi:MAG: FtsW/RodA/SpoVE family cell cycle protein [Anaerolineae bacterium]|nr:FtsW/RodA/SpoVE family cell cycle protein [Anaerolineae bacterium]
MGTTNFVKASPGNSERVIQQTTGLRLKLDVPMLIAVVLLLAIGLVMVYSSSMKQSSEVFGNPYEIFKSQAIYVMLGVMVAFIAYRFDYRWFRPLAPWMMAILVILLVVVLFIPQTEGVPKRTLFQGSIQPSELAKVAIVIYLAVWIGGKQQHLNQWVSGLAPLLIIVGGICMLIFAQPDISAALTIIILGTMMFFLGNGDWRMILLMVVVGLIIGGVAYLMFDTVQDRINAFIGIDNELAHVEQATAAIIRGGWFGTRLGEGPGKFIGLPVPWTDSIFAVIVEELGFIGGAFVIFLYVVILWRGLKIAEAAPDLTAKLLAGGLTCWLTFEAFLNIGVMLDILPVAGNALPFISYGGSIMLTTLGTVGLIFSINRATIEHKMTLERSTLDAAVDLRRGDRRGRVPRADRPARTARNRD